MGVGFTQRRVALFKVDRQSVSALALLCTLLLSGSVQPCTPVSGGSAPSPQPWPAPGLSMEPPLGLSECSLVLCGPRCPDSALGFAHAAARQHARPSTAVTPHGAALHFLSAMAAWLSPPFG